jgi:hypothetical protein
MNTQLKTSYQPAFPETMLSDNTSHFSFNSSFTGVDRLSAAYDEHKDINKRNAASPRRYWRIYASVLLLLLCGNLAMWWCFTHQGVAVGEGNEIAIAVNLSPEKIDLPSTITSLDSSAATTFISPALAAPAVVIPANPPETTEPIVAVVEKTVCYVWEFIHDNEFKRAESLLAEQAWSGFVTEMVDEPLSYMVFVGVFKTRAEIDTKIKVLEKMKIKNYSVLPSGAIALSVVATAQAAIAYQTALTKRGLLGVQYSERQSNKQRLRYRFAGLTSDSQKELVLLAKDLGTLRVCS